MKSEDIVRVILRRIEGGDLKAGDKLPTHRNMAYQSNCSVGTVTRAYAELERKGVTYGQVGRGTFILGTQQDEDAVGRGMFLPKESDVRSEPGIKFDLSLNSYYHPDLAVRYQKAFQMLAKQGAQTGYRGYFDGRGRAADRHCGRLWLEPLVGSVDDANILITQGAQSALYLSIAALTSPGDSIATEGYGYPGIKAAAQENGVRIAALDMDEDGMIPASFEAAAKRGKIKLLITVPTNHNPTGTTVPFERRLQIVKIAQDYNILILEDGVYGPLQNTSIPTYYEINPDISLYLTSFSKVFSPGLRVGYLVLPDFLVARFTTRMTAINWMTSPITLDIVNYLIDTGILKRHQQQLLDECDKRYADAVEILKPVLSLAQLEMCSSLSHLWVKLPSNMAISDFIEQTRREGVSLIGGDRFVMNRQIDDHFVRICLMAVPTREQLKQALYRVSDILMGERAQTLIS